MVDLRYYPVDDQTMGGMLRWHAVNRPTETAVVCGQHRLSWAQLNQRANLLANALLGQNLRRGDRIALLLGNCVEYVEIYQALAKTGMTAVPVNTQLTAPEAAYIINDCAAAAIIYDRGRTPLIEAMQQAGDLHLPAQRRIDLGGANGVSYADLLDAAGDGEPPVEATGEDHFFQGYTSGTTGRPKGCVQRHGAFVAHYKRSFTVYRHGPEDVTLIPGPLFHEAPVLFTLAQLFYGGTVIVLPEFAADAALAEIERHRCTIVGFAVPTMLDRMVHSAGSPDLSSMRSVITAGAPLHQHTMDAVLERFTHAELHEFYGATELGLITDVDHRQHRHKDTTTGPPIPGVNVLVLDDEDNPLPPGQVGQIFVTPIMMDGYHNRPEATAADTREFDGTLWFTLGDVGYIDDDGFLYLVDRKNHMIITGGENVYPAEVENVLLNHPAIDDVAVIGQPDNRWGEAVTAIIATPNDPPSLEEVKAFCRQQLASYKIPKQIRSVNEIPRNPSGKIFKHVLQQQLR